MNDDAERIRRQMQDVRQDMGAEVVDLVRGARQLTDWRHYVRQHPWACVGGAFALGFLVSPARKKLLAANIDVDALVAQLKSKGLAAATGAAPLYPGGTLGKLLAVAGPIVARNVANLVAQRLAAAAAAHHDPVDAQSSTPAAEAP
jgi:hypothetical protein